MNNKNNSEIMKPVNLNAECAEDAEVKRKGKTESEENSLKQNSSPNKKFFLKKD